MGGRSSRLTLVALMAVLMVGLAPPAHAAVAVSKLELRAGTLRIEGTAIANRAITVDGVQMATSTSAGQFRIDRAGFTAPADCTIDLNDGSATPTNVTLPGCTRTVASLSSTALIPSTLEGGATGSATVTLSAPAPSGGAVVALSSSNPAVATVPASLTVPAGSGSATTTSVATSEVSATTTAVISATYDGVTRSATLTVTPPSAPPPPPPPPSGSELQSLTLSPSTVQSGTTSTSATVAFTAATPAGGATLTLSSSNTSVATVPATVTVPALSFTGAFPVFIAPSAAGTATISATYNGITRSALLTVTSQSLLRITTSSVLPNARVGQSYTGYIEACCGQGGPIRWSLVNGRVPDGLRFAANNLGLIQTTAVLGTPTRAQTASFTIRARDAAGNTATKTFTLTVDPAP